MSSKKQNKKAAAMRPEARAKLELWQSRLAQSDNDFSPEVEKMNEREKLYNGDNTLRPLVVADKKRKTPMQTGHVRNIIFENIESQISTSIPQPLVSARRKKDEPLAEVIERFIRNELNRLPFETINDMAERTVPIQGGTGFLIEWDDLKRSHTSVGELLVSMVHPKQFGPQPKVYTGIEDMDWFIVKKPTTKNTVKRRYGVDVTDESESEPEIRSTENDGHSEDALTQYIGYERNDRGGIDKFSWVNDRILEDLENYQARRRPVCAKCGRPKPVGGQVIQSVRRQAGNLLPDPASGSAGALLPEQVESGHAMARQMADALMQQGDERPFMAGAEPGEGETPEVRYDGGPCPWCGGKSFQDKQMEYEEVFLPITTAGGLVIPGGTPGFDENGNAVFKPTLIPYYVPDIYPIVLQKSVSVYGQLLGNSDVDVIRDQQNTINRLEQKIIDRLLKAGSRITLPNRPDFKNDPEDGERWFLDKPADKALIDLYTFSGDLQYELTYLAQVYEEPRQILGITDSFQGRVDRTATSGKAKEFSAAQAAGRLESKRQMKNAAYARIFEIMFKFALAYSDEPRPVSYKNFRGETEYQEFNRYDFLERDENGEYWYNDQFLFACDTTAPLAGNREAMWQETRMNLQTGAFGDPASTETLILFWAKMEELHYPGAGSTRKFLEDRLERERQQDMAQMQPTPAQPMGFQAPPQQAQ